MPMPTPQLEHAITARRTHRTRRTRELVELAQERFYGCDVCRHDDSYDCIDDVVGPLRLLKHERERLFRILTCPGCESRVQSGTFILGTDRSQLRRLALSKRFDRLHKRELEEFRDLLLRYPMLGAEHPFGRRLAKAVSLTKKINLAPALWFRATTDTKQPALGPRPRELAARAYRFNQIGQVAWYLGEDARTAAVEVLREPRPGVSFATAAVKILEPVRVLDLRLPLWGHNPTESWILREVIAWRFVSEPTDDLDESRPQYRVPQYIADLARRHGFGGILYDSTRPSAYNNPEAWGTNLVLFDPVPQHELAPIEVMEFGEPDSDIFGSKDRWPLHQHIPTNPATTD
jgi:RES domain-containing protein